MSSVKAHSDYATYLQRPATDSCVAIIGIFLTLWPAQLHKMVHSLLKINQFYWNFFHERKHQTQKVSFHIIQGWKNSADRATNLLFNFWKILHKISIEMILFFVVRSDAFIGMRFAFAMAPQILFSMHQPKSSY